MNFNQDGYADALGLNQFRKTQGKSTALLDLSLYELGGLAARIVDMPADAAISRSLHIEGDKDSAILAELERLSVLPSLADMVRWSRLFGGAALVLLTDDGGRLNEPLSINRMQRINEVRVFDLTQIQPTEKRYLDPTQTNYGRFETYRINIGAVSGQLDNQVEVHETRLLFMGGDPLPKRLKNGVHWIGRSVTKTVFEKIRQYQNALAWSALILQRKQQAIHKMKGLAAAIDQGLENQVRNRINLVERARSMLNGVAVDSEDDYTISQSDLSGVVDVLDEFKVAISADCHIPVAILFGQSAKGMNATGENDLESYYDLIEGIQQHKMKPVLEKLIELILRQKHLQFFENWEIQFPSLNTPSDKEQAETRKANADAAKAESTRLIELVDAGVLSAEEVRTQVAEEFNISPDKMPEIDDETINDYQNSKKAKDLAVPTRN
ncbi:DUF1073 domain-containing protein [Pasteurella caecimuris]|uniref:phage portal protein n=1 Tax=Rodentibacter caecimuris TaxID=1796644 RepID=UPI0021500CF6|nr:DUF1073 domain-containing protein [Pasteurella caecimuris]MCR1838596.1 DUF1073 domain-containing protein [Pasteurella caecimuris]MCU0107893.1 DUF1073 domain-containing protein [Pasteurella caecimuris]